MNFILKLSLHLIQRLSIDLMDPSMYLLGSVVFRLFHFQPLVQSARTTVGGVTTGHDGPQLLLHGEPPLALLEHIEDRQHQDDQGDADAHAHADTDGSCVGAAFRRRRVQIWIGR